MATPALFRGAAGEGCNLLAYSLKGLNKSPSTENLHSGTETGGYAELTTTLLKVLGKFCEPED